MANPIRIRAINGLTPGDVFTFQRTFTRKETLLFGDMTRDYNPVHLVGSMICEFGGQVGWLATGMSFKFISPVYFGDTIQCAVTITKIEAEGRAKAEAVFINQDEKQVCYAHMTGRLPMTKEKDILSAMVKEGDPSNQLTDEQYPLIDYR